MRKPLPLLLCASLLSAALLLGCGDDSTAGGGGAGGDATNEGGQGGGAAAEPQQVSDAIDACYRTLQGATEERDQAIVALEEAALAYPENGRAQLFLGMCSLAALAEDNDLTALARIEPALERAIELLPEDHRIPGWLATVRVQTAIVLNDDESLALAIEEMIAAADLDPQFNNVSLAIAFAGLPLDTPYPQMAVERLEAIEDCGETDERCRDNEAAPHNVPGSLMLFGDVYARVGDLAAASAYYEQALGAESAGSWPYQADAEAMFEGVEARVETWSDADTTNDPSFFLSGVRTCTGCHE